MKTFLIRAFNAHSTSSISDVFAVRDEEDFKGAMKQFESEIPFLEYYLELESDDEQLRAWLDLYES